MEYQDIWQEFTTLLPDAQALVADFIASLKQCHNKSQFPGQPEQKDWRSDPFIGLWQDREDMQDSTVGFAPLVPQKGKLELPLKE